VGDPSRRLGQPAGPADGPSHEGPPIDDAEFEDTIPDGADNVTVWDHGTYANRTEHEMINCLVRGHLSFRLNGKKLNGGYALTRVREGEEETWLLVKRQEGEAPRNPYG
jgi:DNA ligase D-like protein (predicted 3'-phosphoesterase)